MEYVVLCYWFPSLRIPVVGFQGPSMLWHVSVLHSFLVPNNISWYGETVVCLSIYELVDIPPFGYYKQCYSEYSRTGFCMDVCFQFSWVYTCEQNDFCFKSITLSAVFRIDWIGSKTEDITVIQMWENGDCKVTVLTNHKSGDMDLWWQPLLSMSAITTYQQVCLPSWKRHKKPHV